MTCAGMGPNDAAESGKVLAGDTPFLSMPIVSWSPTTVKRASPPALSPLTGLFIARTWAPQAVSVAKPATGGVAMPMGPDNTRNRKRPGVM